jgi:hypothetical protein
MATTIPSATPLSPDDCVCVEPGCGFLAPPRALLDNLVAVHSLRAARITYGAQYQLVVPTSERQLLLLGEKDERVFLLSVGDDDFAGFAAMMAAAGAAEGWGPSVDDADAGSADGPQRAIKKVSVVCLSASAATRPKYAAELSADGGATMGASVSNSSGPCGGPGVSCILTATLHGAAKSMHLRIRIVVRRRSWKTRCFARFGRRSFRPYLGRGHMSGGSVASGALCDAGVGLLNLL